MPRVIGMRWGRKSTATMPGLALGSRPAIAGDPGELLLDLGDVPMTADAVRLHALVHLPEHEVRLGLAPGARDAALGVDDEVLDEPGARQRREREERRGRIAARRADDADRRVDERRQLLAMELRQTVDRVLEEVGARMLEAVPARVVGRVAQSEVGALVDDRRARGDEVGDELRRGAVREGEEDRVRGRQLGVDVEIERRRDGRGRRAIGSWSRPRPDEPDQLDVRVPRQQPNQLAADVAGRPDDPDADHARRPRRAPRPARKSRSSSWTYDYTEFAA